ncbi:MAG: T9SS type A sorting domain-containing protein [Deltaproteobacteria bacterium]
MKRTFKLLRLSFTRFSSLLLFISAYYPALFAQEINIIVKDTVIGTLDCKAYDIVLEAYIEDVCVIGETKWTYLLINSDYGDTLQYSHNYLPLPGEGIAGNENFDILTDIISARMMITKPLGYGNYKMVWQVSTQCGNTGQKEQLIKIVDKTPPVPVLDDIVSYYGYINGNPGIKAVYFDKGFKQGFIASHDNCAGKDQLFFTYSPMLPNLSKTPEKWAKQLGLYGRYYFDPIIGSISTEAKFLNGTADAWDPAFNSSSRVFSCDDIYINHVVEPKIYVWDEFALPDLTGDQNYKIDTCILYLSNIDCPGNLAGNALSYKSDKPVSEFIVTGRSDQRYWYALTDSKGFYVTEHPTGLNKIEGYKDSDHLNGVSTLDILLIRKHILGIKPFDDLFQYITADVNNSSSVTTADALDIKKVILGYKVSFTRKSWIGVKKDFIFKDPLNTYSEFDNASIFEYNFHNDYLGDQRIDFKVFKTGDVDFSANPLTNRYDETIKLIINDIELNTEKLYEIPVFSDGLIDLTGMQFALDMSNFSDFEIKSGEIKIADEDYNFIDNKFLFSYSPVKSMDIEKAKVLFTLLLRPVRNAKLSSLLNFFQNIMSSEVYTGESVSEIILDFRNHEFEVSQNDPNPFSTETFIDVYLPESSEFELIIFGPTGKKLNTKKFEGIKGMNRVRLVSDFVISSGTYFYTINSKFGIKSKKMLIKR